MEAPPTVCLLPSRKHGVPAPQHDHAQQRARKLRGGGHKPLPPHQQSTRCIGCFCIDPHLFPVPVPFVGPENVGVCRKHYMWLRRHFGLEKASLHTKCQNGVVPSRCAKLLDQFKAHGVVFPLKPGKVPPSPPSSSRKKRPQPTGAAPQPSSCGSGAGFAHRGASTVAPPVAAHHYHHRRDVSVDMYGSSGPPSGASSYSSSVSTTSSASSSYRDGSPTVVPPLQRSLSPSAGLGWAGIELDLAFPAPGMEDDDDDDDYDMMQALDDATFDMSGVTMLDANLQAAERARQARARADAAAMAVTLRARQLTHTPPVARAVNPHPQKRRRAAHGLPMYVPTTARTSTVPPLLKPGTIPRHRLHLIPKKPSADATVDTATVTSALSVAMGESAVDDDMHPSRNAVSSGEYEFESVYVAKQAPLAPPTFPAAPLPDIQDGAFAAVSAPAPSPPQPASTHPATVKAPPLPPLPNMAAVAFAQVTPSTTSDAYQDIRFDLSDLDSIDGDDLDASRLFDDAHASSSSSPTAAGDVAMSRTSLELFPANDFAWALVDM